MTYAAGVSQKPSASSRGNATRLDPISSGPKYWPNGPRMTEDIIIIIIVPCSPTTIRYCSGPMRWYDGESSSLRMAMANRPPVRK